MSTDRPQRVRVTAPRRPRALLGGGPRGAPVRGGPVRIESVSDADAVFARGLIRTQLRLAIGCAIGCCLTIGVLAVLFSTLPALHTSTVRGIPWSWVLQAYGMYPVVVVFGAAYIRAATGNERRYRSLRGQE